LRRALTAPDTVDYALACSPTAGDIATGLFYPVSQSVGPATSNGKAVTVNGQPVVQTITTMSDGSTSPQYWTTTSNNVAFFSDVYPDGITSADTPIETIPLNMQPGQSITENSDAKSVEQLTFVGFETLALAGKTFSNACHFSLSTHIAQTTGTDAIDNAWYAAGYGAIQDIDVAYDQAYTMTQAYNGDLPLK
jgi:hypothetical protein